MRLVAHVTDVDAAVTRRNPGQLDHFLGRREAARHIEQARGQPEGAASHRLLHFGAHLFQLCVRRRPVVETDDELTHRAVADEAAEVDGRRALLQAPEVVLERQRRAAIGSADHGRHPLPYQVLGVGPAEDAAALRVVADRVAVNVDDPGHDGKTGHIQPLLGRGVAEIADFDNPVPADADVGNDRLGILAAEHRPAKEQHVKRLPGRLLGTAGQEENDNEDSRQGHWARGKGR